MGIFKLSPYHSSTHTPQDWPHLGFLALETHKMAASGKPKPQASTTSLEILYDHVSHCCEKTCEMFEDMSPSTTYMDISSVTVHTSAIVTFGIFVLSSLFWVFTGSLSGNK